MLAIYIMMGLITYSMNIAFEKKTNSEYKKDRMFLIVTTLALCLLLWPLELSKIYQKGYSISEYGFDLW